MLTVVRAILSWSLRSQLQGQALWKGLWWDEMNAVRTSERYPQLWSFFLAIKHRYYNRNLVGAGGVEKVV